MQVPGHAKTTVSLMIICTATEQEQTCKRVAYIVRADWHSCYVEYCTDHSCWAAARWQAPCSHHHARAFEYLAQSRMMRE